MAKVLIADDSDMMRKIARMSIEKGGHQVVEASTGSAAVEIALREMPQVVLLDAEMPEMDGWEASKAIRSNPRTAHIPILMCTGHDLSEEPELLTESGADGYVTKPYNPVQILQKITEVLAKA
ncbi:MAG: response regulator [Endomicrobiales bacterium]